MMVDDLLLDKDVSKVFTSEKSVLINKISEFMVHLIQNLRNMEILLPTLHKQGKERANKGATKEIYEKMSQIITNCIEKAMGLIMFDNKTRDAWNALFSLIIQSLLKGDPNNQEGSQNEGKIENKDEEEEEEDDKCIDYEFLNKQVSELVLRLFSVMKKKKIIYPSIFKTL